MIEHFTKLKTHLSSLITIDDDSFDQFAKYVQLKQVKKGELLLRGGDRCENLYFVIEGLFRIYNLKNGNEVNTCFCGENEFTSSFESFTTNSESKEFIEALENSTVLSISNRDLAELIELNPIWDEKNTHGFRMHSTVKSC